MIKAEVPLAEMFGYSTTLRSLSQGRATYTMEFKHYTEAPKNVAEAVINKKTTASNLLAEVPESRASPRSGKVNDESETSMARANSSVRSRT